MPTHQFDPTPHKRRTPPSVAKDQSSIATGPAEKCDPGDYTSENDTTAWPRGQRCAASSKLRGMNSGLARIQPLVSKNCARRLRCRTSNPRFGCVDVAATRAASGASVRTAACTADYPPVGLLPCRVRFNRTELNYMAKKGRYARGTGPLSLTPSGGKTSAASLLSGRFPNATALTSVLFATTRRFAGLEEVVRRRVLYGCQAADAVGRACRRIGRQSADGIETLNIRDVRELAGLGLRCGLN